MIQHKSSFLSINAPANSHLVILDQWEDFLPRINAWQIFQQTLPDPSIPFYEPEWLKAAWDYPGTPMKLALIISEERIITAMAFCPRWNTGFSVLVPVRSIHCMPHLPMLYPTESFLATSPGVNSDILEWSITQTLKYLTWDVGIIGFLNERTQWFESALNHVIQQQEWNVCDIPCSDEAIIDFPESFDTYWSTRSGNMRQKIKKGERILKESGTLRIIDLTEEEYNWEQSWNVIKTIYDSSWQKNAGVSPFDHPWRDINLSHIQSYYQKNRVRLYVMFFNDIPIAYDLWLTGGKALYGLARGMNSNYRNGSAGDVLAKWGIDQAYHQGFERIYMGPVNDQPHYDYKKRWLTQILPYRKIQFVRPWSWYGFLDCMINKVPPFQWIWKKLNLTGLSHKLFYMMQSLRNRCRNAG